MFEYFFRGAKGKSLNYSGKKPAIFPNCLIGSIQVEFKKVFEEV